MRTTSNTTAFTGAALMVLAAAGSVAHAATTVGNPDSGNCYPFSCFAGDGGSTWQQVYSGAAFSGPSSFNSFSLFKYPDYEQGPMGTATFDISFYLTASSPDQLSRTAAQNQSTLLAHFGSFIVRGVMPDELSFTGSTIHYDPSQGNLLMHAVLSGVDAQPGYNSFFQADSSGRYMARYFAYRGSDTGNVDYNAPVTRFSTQSVNDVPEPATWALSLLALGAGALTIRQVKRAPH